MSRKQCKRTIRDPRAWIEKRTLLDQSQKRDIGIPCRLAVEAMKTGHGNQGEAWGILMGSIQTAILLAEDGIGANIISDLNKAQSALERVKNRAERTQVWAFDGEGMQAVIEAIGLHEQQLEAAPVGRIEAALQEVKRRVESEEVGV